MSHHGIHLLPGLLPLQKPLRLDKKRRLRKKNASGVASARETTGAGDIDELFLMDEESGEDADFSAGDDMETGRLILSSFSGATMRSLLEAQEEC